MMGLILTPLDLLLNLRKFQGYPGHLLIRLKMELNISTLAKINSSNILGHKSRNPFEGKLLCDGHIIFDCAILTSKRLRLFGVQAFTELCQIRTQEFSCIIGFNVTNPIFSKYRYMSQKNCCLCAKALEYQMLKVQNQFTSGFKKQRKTSLQ